MNEPFDEDEARRFLINRNTTEIEKREQERKTVLAHAIESLKSFFSGSAVEVYLVGSITQPYKFHSRSDVDIVLKNFKGDRFEVWTKMEDLIKRNVEIIRFENCHFQEHVLKEGYKVL